MCIFILNNQLRHYARQTLKLMNIVGIGFFIIVAVIFIKYKPAYKVSFQGQEIGYIENKEEIEQVIQQFVNTRGENIAFVELEEAPEFEFELINKTQETQEEELLSEVKNSSTITYRTFAITLDGESESFVSTIEEADTIVEELKAKYGEDLDIGVQEVFTENTTDAEAVEMAIAKSNIDTEIQLKEHGVNGILLSTPVTGSISSRFGSRWGGTHTGLDIATSSGTPIYACSKGTVIFAGTSGGYGKIVKISHGNGVETWYAHCSKLFVTEGQEVESGEHIAAVGSTGNSTGPHLHLEVRVDGQIQNPQNYLYK